MSDDSDADVGVARRLAALRVTAADAYDAIAAADAALRSLAERRVAAERVLRQAAARRRAAARAVAAHVRGRPGWFRRLTGAFRAGGLRADRDWSERLLALDARQAETEPPLTAAAGGLARAKDEFTAQLRARAEAVAVLRTATAGCAAVQAELAAGGQPERPGGH